MFSVIGVSTYVRVLLMNNTTVLQLEKFENNQIVYLVSEYRRFHGQLVGSAPNRCKSCSHPALQGV